MKRIILISIFIILAGFMACAGYYVFDYFRFHGIVKEIRAESTIPFVDASNKITKVMQCVPDPTLITSYSCEASCPLLMPILALACSPEISAAISCLSVVSAVCEAPVAEALACTQCFNYIEVQTTGTSQHGTPVFGIPTLEEPVLVKGPYPMINGQIIYAGSSNVVPWVIGTSMPSAVSTIEKIKNQILNFFIAGFKN